MKYVVVIVEWFYPLPLHFFTVLIYESAYTLVNKTHGLISAVIHGPFKQLDTKDAEDKQKQGRDHEHIDQLRDRLQ